MRLGDVVMVYGDNGIAALVPKITPAATFGMKELANVGIPCKGAVGGDDSVHAFVDQKGYLWVVRKGTEPKCLGYREFMNTMALDGIMVSYDSGEGEFFISDGDKGFLLTVHGEITATGITRHHYGLCEVHQLVTSCASLGGSSIGVYDDSQDMELRIETDTIDYGLRALKTIVTLETQAERVAVDWNRDSAFKSLPWVRTSDTGFATIQATATEFRLRAKYSSYVGAKLDYIKSRFKLVDKRAIRGVYAS